MPSPQETRTALQRIGRILLGTAVVLATLYLLKPFYAAIAWGAILAICVWPLYLKLVAAIPRNELWRTVFAPLAITGLSSLVLLVPLLFFVFEAGQEVLDGVPYMRSVLVHGINTPEWIGKIPVLGEQFGNLWSTKLGTPQAMRILLTPAIYVTRNLGLGVAHLSVQFLFAITTLFFLLRYGASLIEQLTKLSYYLFGRQGEILGEQIIQSVSATLTGLVMVGLAEGAIIGVSYVIAGAPQPLVLALVTAVASMIPFVGGLVLAGCCLLIALHSVSWAIGVFVAGYLVQTLADQFVRPTLIGGRTNLPFLWVLFGILGGIEGFGLLGLFIGPAIMACMNRLWNSWLVLSDSES